MNIELSGDLFINLEKLPKIRWDHPDLFTQIGMDLLKGKESCKIKITIEPFKELKTNPQLRFYKGVMLPYINQWIVDNGTQVSKYETDMFLRQLFCFEEVQGQKIPKDLAAVSKEEMSSFITQVEEWRTQLDIYIPINNEL